MSRCAYHDLHDAAFQRLVAAICHFLLGAGHEFSPGRDGGRDYQFTGIAAAYPSRERPLSGKFIVQVKHTTDPIAKCSDPEFSGDAATSVLSLELPTIRALRESDSLDHYLLFTNRRISGEAQATTRDRIVSATGVTSAYLAGTEDIDRYLKLYPQAAALADLREVDGPLRPSPDELADVVVAISAVARSVGERRGPAASLDRVRFSRKNELNGLSPEMAHFIIKNYHREFPFFGEFLANPDNLDVQARYIDAAEQFAAALIAHRSEAGFDKLLHLLIKLLIERDPDLKRNVRLTRALVYYMYEHCDIGTPTEGEPAC